MRSTAALLLLLLVSLGHASQPHWAFQPVRPVQLPGVEDRAWPRNPIDVFVLARLEARGWRPAPPASPRALLRRIHLDLTGLPPTLAQQDAFLADPSPDAYRRVVEQLLGSPGHGERYARHWLDVARYGDTNGYERDADKPGAWRYRDWVIGALNAKMPFDRFILEQLAGDELADADTGSMLATGFLRLGPWDDEPADPKTDRFDQLDDIVSTTSEAFLGLTLACARCHDHKFEPLTMRDYYQTVAIFDPLHRPRDGRTELDRPALPHSRRGEIEHLERERLALRRLGRAGALFGVSGKTALAQREARLADLPRGYFLEERSATAPVTHILKRGRADTPGAVVGPGVPALLAAVPAEFLEPGPYSTRRRLSLARWIARGDNPLTARVIVNRVWQWHFGEGLVRTPSDYGIRGARPTHPELLDWLASWFVEQDWSLEKLHRLIVTSRTYQMSKTRNAEYARVDPEDRLLWRFPYLRLEAEVIRDTMLAATGRLDRQMYGPGIRPPIPRAALEGHSDPDTVWRPDPDQQVDRRTVYIHVKRSLLVPMIEALDFCDTTRGTPRRAVTTVAPQALILFNGDFVNRQAEHLAERLAREAGPDDTARIERAFRLLLCRPATPTEQRVSTESLSRHRRSGLSAQAAWKQLCRVLLNVNELAYPD